MADADPILDKMPHSARSWLTANFELISVIVMSVTALRHRLVGLPELAVVSGPSDQLRRRSQRPDQSVRASNEARQATSIHLAVFIAWLDATTDGEEETAEFIYEGMPERLRNATDAWLAEDPVR